VIRDSDKFTINIDLNNTLAVLKFKIFLATKIHPANQIVKFAGTPLTNVAESISSFGIKDNSIIELAFRQNSNLVPCTFADKFYYKDVKHTREQSEDSLTSLRANLLILAAHLADDDKLKFAVFIRGLTQNLPLVFALKCLFVNDFLSQAHRIALEEGLLIAVS
jgi:Ubiquitin family